MDRVVRGCWAPRCRSMGPLLVPLQGSGTTPDRRQEVDSTSEGSVVGGVFISRIGRLLPM